MKASPSKKQAAPAAQAFMEELARSGQAGLAMPVLAEKLEQAPEGEAMAWDDQEVRREPDYAWAAADEAAPMPPPASAPPPLGGMAPPGGGPERARRQAAPPRPAGALIGSSPRKPAPPPKAAMSSYAPSKTSEELQLESTGPLVVETGFWIWRNVIVPPNVYVVHTRRGRTAPVTSGLGKSFRYNPVTDSYLVVPAAMQTIGIFAKCISAEKQGIHVLAYVQWLISDFDLAYKRLDFSNTNDPMGIVNSQLREQAEAAIKDTVSTMTVEQVLTDKAPIIQELTERMKSVAEGRDGDGLGLKIVTVQIKEAVVASAALFEHLQAPYRHAKARLARLSEIETDAEVNAKARESEVAREAADARASSEIARLRAETNLSTAEADLAARVREEELTQQAEQAEQQYREATELARLVAEARRAEEASKTALVRLAVQSERQKQEAAYLAAQQLEELKVGYQRDHEARRLAAENERQKLQLDQELALARLAAQTAELAAQERVDAERRAAEHAELASRLGTDQQRHAARLEAERKEEEQRQALAAGAHRQHAEAEREAVAVERLRQETANAKSEMAVQSELVHLLPEIASHMPDIQEYRYVGVSEGGGASPFGALPEFMAKALGVANAFGWRFNAQEPKAVEPGSESGA